MFGGIEEDPIISRGDSTSKKGEGHQRVGSFFAINLNGNNELEH
jgi:hypothetical protein